MTTDEKVRCWSVVAIIVGLLCLWPVRIIPELFLLTTILVTGGFSLIIATYIMPSDEI